MPLTVQALDHLVIQVSDLEVSARWYERVLGMTREEAPPAPGKAPRTAMKFGRQDMIKRFEQSTRPGFYLSVSKEGAIAAGDSIEKISNDNAATVIEAL